jgi:hypothetical protein
MKCKCNLLISDTDDMLIDLPCRHMTPLPVLHPAVILAFMAFILVISLCERIPLSEATAIASELSERFDLDVSCDDSGTLSGSDLVEVQRTSCILPTLLKLSND